MHDATGRSVRRTFFIFSSLLTLWAWKFYPSPLSPAFAIPALALFLLAVFRPMTLLPLFRMMQRYGRLVSGFNTRLLLGLVFFLFFPLIRFILGLSGRDFMQRKLGGQESYWEDYRLSGLEDRRRYERQF